MPVGFKLAAMLVALCLMPGIAFAATSGPRNAGTGATALNGAGFIAWTNPSNITTPGAPYATCVVPISGKTQYLNGTNYGFSIPAGATINGITVVINRTSTTNVNIELADSVVQLYKGGVLSGNNKAAGVEWPTSLGTATYGSGADLWGTTWTPAQVNSSSFGVALAATNASPFFGKTGTVDYIQVTVTYTPTVLTVASAHPPVGLLVAPGTRHSVDGFTLRRTSGAAAISVDSVTIDNTGTDPATDITGVDVYLDDGATPDVWDSADTTVSTSPGTFTGSSTTVALSPQSITGTAKQYWVVYEIATDAGDGDVVSSKVTGVGQTGADSVTNSAVVGSTFTIDALGPDVAITTPTTDEILAGSHKVIAGSASDIAGVALMEVRITRHDADFDRFWNGSTWVDTPTYVEATLVATGTVSTLWTYDWTFDPAVQPGSPTYDIDARGMDSIGNLEFATTATDVTIDNVSPVTASVTDPVDLAAYRSGTMPATFSGSAADNTGGSGLAADSTYFTLKNPSGKYWDGTSWETWITGLGTTHSATTSGTVVTWSSAILMPDWSAADEGTYTVQATATDRADNAFTGTAITFFLGKPRTITAMPSLNGTITPTTQSVDYDSDSASLTITPNTGYHFVSASDKDGPVTTVAGTVAGTREYKFNNVKADNTLTAVFAIDTFTITALPSLNGTITPTTQSVDWDSDSASLTITPNTGYHFV
ncbi:MAG: hypothetical protein WCP28_12565, partial [Actinomycetes bacterium]